MQVSACMVQRSQPTDDVLTAAGIAPFYIDGALMNLDDFDLTPPLEHPERLIFIQEWVRNANSWYLPFLVRYLPSLKEQGYRRLLPILGSEHGNFLTVTDTDDIEINLLAKEWATHPQSLTLNLRELIIRSIIAKKLKTVPGPENIFGEKANVITEIYTIGIPAYLSSFGSEKSGSALAIVLDGNRTKIEKYFDQLRREMNPDEARSSKNVFDAIELDEPISRNDATKLVGLWIAYRVESILGSDAMIEAINHGPERLYELYLSTGPGILRSLELIPEEARPLLNDSITH